MYTTTDLGIANRRRSDERRRCQKHSWLSKHHRHHLRNDEATQCLCSSRLIDHRLPNEEKVETVNYQQSKKKSSIRTQKKTLRKNSNVICRKTKWSK